jgi:hypothetical protein
LLGTCLLVLAACTGSGGNTGGGGGATAAPTGTPTGTAAAPTGTPTGTAPATGSAQQTLTPIAGGGPTGKPVTKAAELDKVLGPGDFAAVGLAGAQEPTVNTTGCAPNCAYLVYKGLSAGDGGYELDIFVSDSAASATADYGSGDMTTAGMQPLKDAIVAQIGADQASFDPAAPGNDSGTQVASLLAQKGRLIFELGIPAGPQALPQVTALGALVLARTAGLQ